MSSAVGSCTLVSTTSSSSPLLQIPDDATTSKTAALALLPSSFCGLDPRVATAIFPFCTLRDMFSVARTSKCSYSFARNFGVPDNVLDLTFWSTRKVQSLKGIMRWVPNLQTITIPSGMQDLDEIKGCPQLSTLTLIWQNKEHLHQMNFLNHCSQLSSLEITAPWADDNNHVDLGILSNSEKISSLTLSCIKIGGAFRGSLEVCPRIRHLALSVVLNLTDADLLTLEAYTQLKTLKLVSNPLITQAGVDALQAKCPNLEII